MGKLQADKDIVGGVQAKGGLSRRRPGKEGQMGAKLMEQGLSRGQSGGRRVTVRDSNTSLATSSLSPHLHFSQAYGARDYKALGEVLQRALLVCWVACVPVALLWSQSTTLMVAVGQDPAIAAMAGRCEGTVQ